VPKEGTTGADLKIRKPRARLRCRAGGVEFWGAVRRFE
jgi:hypothetical protein